MMAVLEDGEVQPFVVGADYGYFCKKCSVVVLDHRGFTQLAGLSSGQDNVPFSVLGLVDLDAIPEEKSHIPLGEDNNPIPLVEFTNLAQEDLGGGNRAARRARRKSRGGRKKRR
jgi:hypothetical protein